MNKQVNGDFKIFLYVWFLLHCVLMYILPGKPSELDVFTNFMASLFIGIETYASASEFPYELRHFFAIHWALVPVAMIIFCNAVKTGFPSKNIDEATALLGLVLSLLFSVMIVNMLGTSGIDNPSEYHGKAAGLIKLLTQLKLSCALISSFLFLVLSIFLTTAVLMLVQLICFLFNKVDYK